jgi:hypothetical protein
MLGHCTALVAIFLLPHWTYSYYKDIALTNRHSLCNLLCFPRGTGEESVLLRCDSASWAFGSRRFERTQPSNFRFSTLQCKTTRLSRNVGNQASSDAWSRLRRTQTLSICLSVLQTTYRDVTMGSGLMEPEGEGRPLLSLQDLESRVVFTRCKVSTCLVCILPTQSICVSFDC